jgi:tRNA threonylcarbamoyladenosine biosynthesis protein TsaB
MRVLALDTTTAAGSVALVDEGGVIAERCGDAARTHAERLPADILALVGVAGATIASVDLFAVACGPGSFTGLRIGIATMQGLAFASNRPMAGVSALEALAHLAIGAAGRHAIVGVWMDAHRREVFSALYRAASQSDPAGSRQPAVQSERLVELEGAAVGDPAATLARWAPNVEKSGAIFIGDGAVLYADVLRRELGREAVVLAPPSLAAAIGVIALGHARRGETVNPSAIRPLYVRRPDAEIARAKQNASRP